MKVSYKHKTFSLLFLGLILILTLVQCSKNVGSIERDNLVLPDGERILVIKTSNSNADENLDTYQLEIQSPSGTQTVTPTSETFTLTELVNGNYTITSLKEGYVGQSTDFLVELPAENSSDYSAEVELQLTKLNPPVEVDNATGGEVEAPPIGDTDSGTGNTAATLAIPANAIAETGTTSISFTQIPPDVNTGNAAGLKSTTFGTATTGFILSPADLYFATPASISFAIAFSPKFISMGIGARMYRYENGVATSDYVEVSISSNGQTATANIPSTGTWKLVEGWAVEFATSRTIPKAFTSNCGGTVYWDHSLRGSWGPEYSERMHIKPEHRTAYIVTRGSSSGTDNYVTTISVQFGTTNYVMSQKKDGAIVTNPRIETAASIPNGQTWKPKSTKPCHDSGGHDSGGN